MIDRDKLRLEFSNRLNLALDEMGMRKHGRGVDIQKELKMRGLKASTESIRKWLSGLAIPEIDNMRALSDITNKSTSWLEYGEGDIDHSSSELSSNKHTNIKTLESYTQLAKPFSYPIISINDVEAFLDKRLSSNKIRGELMSSKNVESSFWVEVTNNSMWSSTPSRITFPEGTNILVNPNFKKPESGKFYLIKLPDGEIVFKLLIRDAGITYLKSLNKDFVQITVKEDECIFLGEVIDRDLGSIY